MRMASNTEPCFSVVTDEDSLPGSKFEKESEEYTVDQLKRWLKRGGLKLNGKRDELLLSSMLYRLSYEAIHVGSWSISSLPTLSSPRTPCLPFPLSPFPLVSLSPFPFSLCKALDLQSVITFFLVTVCQTTHQDPPRTIGMQFTGHHPGGTRVVWKGKMLESQGAIGSLKSGNWR